MNTFFVLKLSKKVHIFVYKIILMQQNYFTEYNLNVVEIFILAYVQAMNKYSNAILWEYIQLGINIICNKDIIICNITVLKLI